MRDKNRIKRIMTSIGEYWEANPDMRLNQLLINLCVVSDGSYWNLDDDMVEERLKANINNLKKIK